jgi:2-methylcitrate dehydratase PrpD
VEVGPPPAENLERYRSGAIVTIRTTDGRTYSSTVHAPKGAAILGIDWSDVERKYRSLVPFSKLPQEKLEASVQVIRNFRQVKNVSELVTLLR